MQVYDRVYRLKKEFPDLEIVINGGIDSLEETTNQLGMVDGVMMGRAAYQNPWLLAQVDETVFSTTPVVENRLEVIHQLIPYIEEEQKKGARLSSICRHTLGLFQGVPGAKRYKRILSEKGQGTEVGIDVLLEAIAHFN